MAPPSPSSVSVNNLTVIEGIARVHGSAPNKKTALLRDPLLEMIDRIDTSATAGLRDRALLLLGFAVGLRRSELVALRIEDLSPSPDGMRIRIARSGATSVRGALCLLPLAAAPITDAGRWWIPTPSCPTTEHRPARTAHSRGARAARPRTFSN